MKRLNSKKSKRFYNSHCVKTMKNVSDSLTCSKYINRSMESACSTINQLIHDALLEWSIAATLAE